MIQVRRRDLALVGLMVAILAIPHSGVALEGAAPIALGHPVEHQVRSGTAMAGSGTSREDDDPTQYPISRPIAMEFVDPNPIIFVPPLTETP